MLWGLEGPESDDWEAGLRGLEARHASSREMRPEEIRRDQKRTEETRREQKSHRCPSHSCPSRCPGLFVVLDERAFVGEMASLEAEELLTGIGWEAQEFRGGACSHKPITFSNIHM